MKIGEIVRREVGEVFYESFVCPETRLIYMKRYHLHANRSKGKIGTSILNGFDIKNRPQFLLRVEVIEQAPPLVKRGRKSTKVALNKAFT